MTGTLLNSSRQIDETDRKLLSYLTEDARTPIAEVARRIGLSRGAVQDRLSRLERDRIITGYSVRLNLTDAAGARAWLIISLTPGVDCNPIVAQLSRMPEVEQCFSVAGDVDILSLVAAPTLEAVFALRGAIAALDGVGVVKTLTVLAEHRPPLPRRDYSLKPFSQTPT